MQQSAGKLLLCLLDMSKVLLTSVHANCTAKGTKKYWIYCLTFCLHQHSWCHSSTLLSQRTAAGSGSGVLPHQGTVFPGSCALWKPLSSICTEGWVMLPPSTHQLTVLETIWPNPQDSFIDFFKFAEPLLILQIFPGVPELEIITWALFSMQPFNSPNYLVLLVMM